MKLQLKRTIRAVSTVRERETKRKQWKGGVQVSGPLQLGLLVLFGVFQACLASLKLANSGVANPRE